MYKVLKVSYISYIKYNNNNYYKVINVGLLSFFNRFNLFLCLCIQIPILYILSMIIINFVLLFEMSLILYYLF